MYLTLFNVAGFAIVAWLLLVLLPTWKVTRRLAESAVFPVFLSVLYLVGIVPIVVRAGPGIMADFGTAEGVLRLLATQDVALIAWIHILAFDQVVGMVIYRDNMAHRYVPLPVQSVILAATLMFGPVGFLMYCVLRAWSRGRRAAHGQPAETEPSVGHVPAADGITAAVRAAAGATLGVLRRERTLTAVALLSILLGVGCAAAIVVRGGEAVGAEGHLQKAMSFDVALGIYLLTLVMLMPLARFSPRGAMAWRASQVVLVLYALGMENVQIARGIDPRFTETGSVADRVLGGFFFLDAVGLIVLFVVLAWTILARRTDGADGPLLLAVRYAGAATLGAFAAGLWMSAAGGSRVGEASLLPLHAVGFHGLQALPLVALLLAWAGVRPERARTSIHAAGCAWLAACAGVAGQAAQGRAALAPSLANGIAAGALLAWAVVAALALRTWLRGGTPAPALRPVAA